MDRLQIGDWLWRRVVQPRLFACDAEEAHARTIELLQRMQDSRQLWLLRALYQSPHVDQPVNIGGAQWRCPVGVAAGLDKQGEVVPALDALGVGAIEVGTVVPEQQDGNPRPRVFRYPQFRALTNRYGFNSVGVEQFALNLQKGMRCNPKASIGVSIGKNKATPDDRAIDDYVKVLAHILPLLREGDYIVVNISSPNTPGLRDIFLRLYSFLGQFMDQAEQVAFQLGVRMPPVHLKLPPDWAGDMAADVEAAVMAAAKSGIRAIQATNTTTDEAMKRRLGIIEAGGLSGAPLLEPSNRVLEVCAYVRRRHALDIGLVGIGGVESGSIALAKIGLGADAVQLYSGLVYRGPGLVHEILKAFARRVG
ncbi:MAG: quinone-dependent dihydroorotate dehydrogenase [Patescibacteria group bacterium]